MQHECGSRGIGVEAGVRRGWKQERRDVRRYDREGFRNPGMHFDFDSVLDVLAQSDARRDFPDSRLKHLVAVSGKGGCVAASVEHPSNRIRVVIPNQQIYIAHWAL